MVDRSRYRRASDLYREGRVLQLRDGTPIWMQVPNAFEIDDARQDAQSARSRIAMALKEEGSDELLKVRGAFATDGHDKAVQILAEARTNEQLPQLLAQIEDDPEWKERMDIINRAQELKARKPDEAEQRLIDKANEEYVAEINSRLGSERAFLVEKFDAMNDEQLLEEYIQLHIDRRGTDVALAEHRLTEVWYAARVCEGVFDKEKSEWDHSACGRHGEKVWEEKADLRDESDELYDLLAFAMDELTMSVRDAKSSGRQGSSSGQSPQPSSEGESTPSTSTEAHATAPGI